MHGHDRQKWGAQAGAELWKVGTAASKSGEVVVGPATWCGQHRRNRTEAKMHSIRLLGPRLRKPAAKTAVSWS